MNTKPFQFRYVREIVGVFVLLCAAILIVSVVLVARAQRWFEKEFEVLVRFPREGTFGVQRGTRVEILGSNAGRVESVKVAPDGVIEGTLQIRSDYVRFLREDSEAVVKKEYGVAGAAYIVIQVGTGAPVSRTGFVLPIRKDTELLEMVQSVVEQIQGAVLPVLREVEQTLAEYRGLAADLRRPDHPLQQLLTNLNAIAIGLRDGEGTVGRLLKDPAIADGVASNLVQLHGVLRQVEQAMTQVQTVLKNLETASAAVPEVVETVRQEMRDVPGLVVQTRATLETTEQLLAGLRRHWLLRGAMRPDVHLEPLSAAEAVEGRTGSP